jgi:hypothetical protein
MVRGWSERDDAVARPTWEPLEPSEDGDGDRSHLIRSSARGTIPRISPVSTPEGTDYILGAGPVGNEGAFDCFWGEMLRGAADRYREREGDIGEFGASITAPAEALVFDIFAHRDLDFALKPEVLVFGRIFPHGRPTGGPDDPSLLPIRLSTTELPGSPPLVSTTLVPQYTPMIKRVYERLGWSPDEFQGTRLIMKYPPLGANVILRFPLPPQPLPSAPL